jgi:membrane-associated HD superfamily phosphohydrolase
MKKLLGIIVAVVAVLGVGGYFLVQESYAATPADPLFGVQTALDNLQRALTFDEVAKTELEQKILERRQEQVERMLLRTNVTEEQLEDALRLMNQQRERVMERLQEVEQNMEQKGNDQAVESLQKVQEQYKENLDRQLETAEKAQEKYSGVGETVRQNIEMEKNSLNNQGEDSQNQQQNQEMNIDNGNRGGN